MDEVASYVLLGYWGGGGGGGEGVTPNIEFENIDEVEKYYSTKVFRLTFLARIRLQGGVQEYFKGFNCLFVLLFCFVCFFVCFCFMFFPIYLFFQTVDQIEFVMFQWKGAKNLRFQRPNTCLT